MSRKYPRIAHVTRIKGKRPCTLCSAPAQKRVWVQISYMRGDDEEAFVCEPHWDGRDKEDRDNHVIAVAICALLAARFAHRK